MHRGWGWRQARVAIPDGLDGAKNMVFSYLVLFIAAAVFLVCWEKQFISELWCLFWMVHQRK